MKKITLAIVFLFLGIKFFAQPCTPNLTYTQTGIYPDTLPTATVGVPYSTDATFVMPLDTGGYDFTNFQILTVTLPVGLSWQCSNYQTGCNYDPWVNQYGCVHVSGTPLLAGFYAIDVTVIADLTIATGIPVNFQIYINVLPATSNTSNNGFSMAGFTGCSPITVNFVNNNPGLQGYYWDFGNTNQTTAENPVPQVYNVPGDYVVHYEAYADTTTNNFYTLTSIDITSIQNSASVWGYPIDGNPDLFVIVKENGTPVYQSSYFADQFPPVGWYGLNINMNPLNTYVLEVWDEDDFEFGFGADDFVGNHTMSLNGCTGCAANISVVNYTVNHTVVPPVPSVITNDTIHVYGYPGIANIVYDSLNHTLHTDSLQYSLQWYLNGSPQLGQNAPTDTVSISGDYYVIAINAFGCTSFSDTVTAIFCDSLWHPAISITSNSFVTIDTTGNTMQWYLNGNPLAGETSDMVNYLTNGNGVYSLEVTNAFGCSFLSYPWALDVGIDENNLGSLHVFPNPAKDELHLTGIESGDKIVITSIVGQEVLLQQLENVSEINLNIANLPSGVYFVSLFENGNIVSRSKFIKQE